MSNTYQLTQPFNFMTVQSALVAAGVTGIGWSGLSGIGGLTSTYYASATLTTDGNEQQATVNAIIAANSITLLQVEQQLTIAALYAQTVDKEQKAFDSFIQFNLLTVHYFAFVQLVLTKIGVGQTQRMSYIQSAFAWMGNIYNAFVEAQAVVNAAQDPATAVAVVLGPTSTQNGTLTANGTVTGNSHTSTTIDNITNTASLLPGMIVTGSGIVASPATYIVTVNANSIVLSQATTTTVTGLTVSYSAFITGLVTAQISTGMTVSGPGVTGNAVVASPVSQTTGVAVTGGTFAANSGQYTFTLPAAPNVTIPGALALPS